MEYPIIGKSKAIENLRKQITKIARGKQDLLLVGDPGVGKGAVAKNIHAEQYGDLKQEDHPFVSINASVVDDKEFETALVGFEKGVHGLPPTTKRGLFEVADGGTILIEEVEEASFRNQMRIRNILETRTTTRIGGSEERPINVRVILTMKQKPDELMESHKLLEDFYQTLKKMETVTIPSLHERPEDIPLLAKYFVAEISKDLGIREVAVDINAIDVLVRHTWKENIRELKAIIDKSVLFSQGGRFVLPPELTDEKTEVVKMINNVVTGQEFVLDNSLDVIEKGIIDRTLVRFGYNQSRTAHFLGMTEQTLRYKLKRLGIPSARKRKNS
jgi:DNA-binding NtrC family response regulator